MNLELIYLARLTEQWFLDVSQSLELGLQVPGFYVDVENKSGPLAFTESPLAATPSPQPQ